MWFLSCWFIHPDSPRLSPRFHQHLRLLGMFGSNEEDPVDPANAFLCLGLDLITRALQTDWSQWGSQCFYNERAEEEKNMTSYYIWTDTKTEREGAIKET